MNTLLLKPTRHKMTPGVTVIQEVTGDNSPLSYVRLKVVDLQQGTSYEERLQEIECCIVALRGTVNVTDGQQTFPGLGTRQTVFDRNPTDSVYVSNNRRFEIEAVTMARVALCYAPSTKQLPTRVIQAADNSIERRGILNNKRLVHNILPDSDPGANSLLVVEVFTEGGNWSSYPPHKHDRDALPLESALEETYYHELDPPQGFVFQRVYTDDLSLDETMTVTNEDVVLVPRGYHPVGVPDGYASYYLNVMAGPHRVWKFHNDPDHAWVLDRPSQSGAYHDV